MLKVAETTFETIEPPSQLASSDRDVIWPPPFRERHWVPWSIAIADIAALEVSVVLAYFLRMALGSWFPIDLSQNLHQGVAVGVLILPVFYFLG